MSTLVEGGCTTHPMRAGAVNGLPTAVTPDDVGLHRPKARLALNVGLIATGAEGAPMAWPAAMAEQVATVLKTAASAAHETLSAAPAAFEQETPRRRLILSRGADLERAAAQVALDLGFQVQVVLAGNRHTLARSLSPAAAAELFDLLDRATAVLELDGELDRATAAREAAEAAAEVLLDQSDLLLVLGDADESSSRAVWYTIERARERELAIVTIREEASSPLGITIGDRMGSPQQVDLAALHNHLVSLASPPAASAAVDPAADQGRQPDPIQDYFAEVVPARSWLAWTWSLFVGLVADGRLRRPAVWFTAVTTSVAEWNRAWQTTPPLPAAVTGELDHALRTAYVWPDSMSQYYGGAYRGSFVVATLLGMATVLLVLFTFAIGSTADARNDLNNLASVAFVLAILAVTRMANQRRWHERWLDYRLLAELLRQQRFLAPLGRVPTFARLPAHDAYDDPRVTWMAWQAHAVARETGLVTTKVDQAYRDAYLAFVRDGLITGIPPDTGQLGYHAAASRRFERLERRAADIREGLMWAAIAVAVIQVADSRVLTTWALPIWFAALIALFTALGGAVSSVSGQADAGRVMKRSRAMHERLEHIRGSLDRPEAAASAAILGETAEAAADAMVAELADYRLVFQGKPLKYPGWTIATTTRSGRWEGCARIYATTD
ncbi:MAG: hypothetical protein H0V24_04155 [Chloroflexia bacterium]|nr:hypothetical protein [Chloroflexia bacterium]